MGPRMIKTVFLFVMAVSFFSWTPVLAEQGDTVAQEAFELRLEGKADEAKALLEKAIAAEPDNAAAHFELARTQLWIGLGNFMRDVDDIQPPIEKAIECDPDNVNYQLFGSYVAFMKAYISLQQEDSNAQEDVEKLCRNLETVARLKPDFCEPLLYLVEIHSTLPGAVGGDRVKAVAYADKLEVMDDIFGAKARSLLLPDGEDKVEYWKGVLEKHQGNADVLEELGRACLYEQQVEEGVQYLEEAVKADPKKKILLLDMGRYHILRVMHGTESKDEALTAAEKSVQRYLDTEPALPLKAYSYAVLAMAKVCRGDKEGAGDLRKQASALDSNYSKASGVPNLALFVPSEEVYRQQHRYLFLPF